VAVVGVGIVIVVVFTVQVIVVVGVQAFRNRRVPRLGSRRRRFLVLRRAPPLRGDFVGLVGRCDTSGLAIARLAPPAATATATRAFVGFFVFRGALSDFVQRLELVIVVALIVLGLVAQRIVAQRIVAQTVGPADARGAAFGRQVVGFPGVVSSRGVVIIVRPIAPGAGLLASCAAAGSTFRLAEPPSAAAPFSPAATFTLPFVAVTRGRGFGLPFWRRRFDNRRIQLVFEIRTRPRGWRCRP
jgi:hypothetical protein